MFRLNNSNIEQMSLFSKESMWSPYQRKLIDNCWVGYFHDHIFPSINEEPYSVLYSSDNASCPNTPVNFLVGVLIIKSITGQSDEEIINSVYFDERVQYALHTINLTKQPISKNMLNLFRNRIRDYEKKTGINLLENTMRELNKIILNLHKIDRSIERMDSMMISSSCKKMSRIELVYTINYNFIKLLEKKNKTPEEFKCYLDSKNKNDVIYRTKVNEEDSKLLTLLQNSLSLYDTFKDDEEVNKSEEFKLLKRIIDEQYDNEKKGPKDGKEIKPDSLQNPSDPNATYRFKYGNNHGYAANMVEAVNDGKPMIVDWEVDTNITSDAKFIENYINKKIENNDTTEITEVVDGAYFSEELDKKAKEANIKLHPTELIGRKPKESNLSEFVIDEETHLVLECPNGNIPLETNYDEEKQVIKAKFEKKSCENCPNREKCPLNFNQKKVNIFKVELSKLTNSKLRNEQKTEQYQKISNMRAGIEGLPSLFRRKYNIDNRGSKGLLRLKIEFSTGVIAINIKRACKIAPISNNMSIIFLKFIKKLKLEYFFLDFSF